MSKTKLSNIVNKKDSQWLKKAKWRTSNQSWLDKSAIIALKILRHLRDNKITQIQLADQMNVSPQQVNKIVKGQENLTLETISKLESTLGITLFEVPGSVYSSSVYSRGLFVANEMVSLKYIKGHKKTKSFDYDPQKYIKTNKVLENSHLKLVS